VALDFVIGEDLSMRTDFANYQNGFPKLIHPNEGEGDEEFEEYLLWRQKISNLVYELILLDAIRRLRARDNACA
jgi:hypothetical protein